MDFFLARIVFDSFVCVLESIVIECIHHECIIIGSIVFIEVVGFVIELILCVCGDK